MRYRAYGVVLESDLALPELDPTFPNDAADLSVITRADPFEEGWRWIQPRRPDEEAPWVAVGASGSQHRVVFDSGADFVVHAMRRRIEVAVRSAPDASVRHRLIDQVIPLSLAHLGGLVLHASAVVLPSGRAVAFVGPSGAGKSTLAASLAQTGADVVADDALVVERRGDALDAVPSYPGVRMRPDILPGLGNVRGPLSDGKRRANVAEGVRFRKGRVRLERIYVLRGEADSVVAIERLPPRDTIMALIAHAFVLDVSDKPRVAAHFGRVVEASALVKVRTLRYPHSRESLDVVGNAIDADLN